MITNKEEYYDYLERDRVALQKKKKRPSVFGDEIWKYEIALRTAEYRYNCRKNRILKLIAKYRLHKLSIRTGFEIPINTCDAGLCLVHRGTVIIATNSHLGENCRIHPGVTIGATNGSADAPVIGRNVFIADGVKIIGKIRIADNVQSGANAVVVSDILEEGTTWGGIPAKIISNNSSLKNIPFLAEQEKSKIR